MAATILICNKAHTIRRQMKIWSPMHEINKTGLTLEYISPVFPTSTAFAESLRCITCFVLSASPLAISISSIFKTYFNCLLLFVFFTTLSINILGVPHQLIPTVSNPVCIESDCSFHDVHTQENSFPCKGFSVGFVSPLHHLLPKIPNFESQKSGGIEFALTPRRRAETGHQPSRDSVVCKKTESKSHEDSPQFAEYPEVVIHQLRELVFMRKHLDSSYSGLIPEQAEQDLFESLDAKFQTIVPASDVKLTKQEHNHKQQLQEESRSQRVYLKELPQHVCKRQWQ